MILEFANTFIGKQGNIGVRTAKILKELSLHNRKAVCVCRGALIREPNIEYIEMGLFGHVPRLLNAARIYIYSGFRHRLPDIRLYEYFSKAHLKRLRRLTTDTAIAHVWDNCPSLIARLKAEGIKVLLDIPMVPSTYGQRMNRSGLAPFLMDDQRLVDIELEAFHEADALIAPSKFVSDELSRIGIPLEKVVVIEFGADIPTAALPLTAYRNSDRTDGLEFCIVGALSPRKGVLDLLSAWSHPAFKRDRLHLCGRVFPEVIRQVAASSSGKILMPGFVNPFDYLRSCDVFVFPSWMEGSAKAVYEAMACGLPVIVTSSAGSIARDGIDGFVIEPGDINTLRDRMLWFKGHPEKVREMGANARERVSAFTWGRYANKVIDLYDRWQAGSSPE
jgi:glycosyltransferase involved in cell wall biosynthesis